ATFARRNVLDRMEAECGDVVMGARSDFYPVVRTTHCVTGVIYQPQVVTIGQLTQGGPVATVAGHVNSDNRTHIHSCRPKFFYILLDLIWIDSERDIVNIDKIWFCANITATIRTRQKSVCRNNDDVTGRPIQSQGSQVEG